LPSIRCQHFVFQYLADAGYEVEEVDAPFSEELSELWKPLIFSEMRQLLEQPIRDYGKT
jgi:hypothetical protein